MALYPVVKLVHVLAAVFLAGLLLGLIGVSQPLGSRPDDRRLHEYLEAAGRRYAAAAQLILVLILAAGVALVSLRGLAGLSAPVLVGKLLFLTIAAGLLSYLRLRVHPELARLLTRVGDAAEIPHPLLWVIEPLRARRRHLAFAALCLEVAAVVLGLEATAPLPTLATLTLILIAGAATWTMTRIAVAPSRARA